MKLKRYLKYTFVVALLAYLSADLYVYLRYKTADRTAGVLEHTVKRFSGFPDESIPNKLVIAYEKVYPGTLHSGFHADLAWLFVMKLQRKHTVEFDLAYEVSHASGIRIYSLANQLNSRLSKKQCIYGYLSLAWFGHDITGVEGAAEFYYQKKLKDLNETQCLELVVMTVNPSLYDKIRSPEVLEEKVRRYDRN